MEILDVSYTISVNWGEKSVVSVRAQVETDKGFFEGFSYLQDSSRAPSFALHDALQKAYPLLKREFDYKLLDGVGGSVKVFCVLADGWVEGVKLPQETFYGCYEGRSAAQLTDPNRRQNLAVLEAFRKYLKDK